MGSLWLLRNCESLDDKAGLSAEGQKQARELKGKFDQVYISHDPAALETLQLSQIAYKTVTRVENFKSSEDHIDRFRMWLKTLADQASRENTNILVLAHHSFLKQITGKFFRHGEILQMSPASTPAPLALTPLQARLKLAAENSPMSVMYDVGAYEGEWTAQMKAIFPGATIYQFEANRDKAPYLLPAPYSCLEVLGAEEAQEVPFYRIAKEEAKGISDQGNSMFCETTSFFTDPLVEHRKTMTLAQVMKSRNLPIPNLLKLDTQGAELAILQGLGSDLLCQVEWVLIELTLRPYNKGAPLYAEVMEYLHRHGFMLYDITELHYWSPQAPPQTNGLHANDLFQFDGLFRRVATPPEK